MISRHTAILMGSYNGAEFLPPQVESILHQSHESLALWVSDDGSVDATVSLLQSYQASLAPSRLQLLRGPGQGFVRNFLSLVCNSSIDADYFAYADQDDVWLPDKLQHAMGVLEAYPGDLPALYCSRTLIIDDAGIEQGQSLLDSAKPSFPNALIQNIASGNTMVFNRAARELLKEAGSEIDVFAHDWWTYLAVMAVGGVVVFDPIPRVQYRQHSTNQVGATLKIPAMLRRSRLDRNGHLRSTFRGNIAALEHIRHRISPENLALLDQVDLLSHPNPLRRLLAFFQLPFKRQRFLGNCSLGLAIFLGRV
jgi:glycosyltransferase involved in cell wall biosynthesis